jgi:hypothetical protein
MNSTSPLMTIEKTCEESIHWTIRLLENAGINVLRTFDLQGARLAHPDCTCPHHGTEACDCQMSVLLVYQEGKSPASILIHGFQKTTWLYLVDSPEQPVDQNMDLLIRGVLAQTIPSSVENR